MTRYTIFATDADGNVKQLKGDPANLERQQGDLERLGYSVTILDDDERIKYGHIAAQLRERYAEDEA